MKPLAALFIVCVIDVLGFGVLIPLIPYIGTQLGAAPWLVTWAFAIYSLCQLLAAPLWGRLSDRFGRRPILISSMLGACASYVLLAMTHSLAMLFLSRALAGIMAGNLSAAMAYASDISRPEERAKAMGTVGAAIGIGFMLGPAIGGALAGEQLMSANFARPALTSATLSLVAMLLVIFLLPESHGVDQRRAQAAAGGRGHPLQLLRQLPALRWLTFSTLLLTFAQSTLDSIFALWSMQRYALGPRSVGMVLFGLAIVVVVLQGGLVRRLAPRFGEYRLALVAVGCYSGGLALLAWGPVVAVVVAGLLLCGVGAGLFSPSGSALASKEASAHNRGAVMGTYQTGTSLARALGPLVSGPVYTRFGQSAPYVVGALVALQAGWCLRAARRVHAARAAARMGR